MYQIRKGEVNNDAPVAYGPYSEVTMLWKSTDERIFRAPKELFLINIAKELEALEEILFS